VSTPAYAIGIDFGTESGRALLLDLQSGEEAAVSEVRYPSAVIDRELPETGEELPADWALQDPDDWVTVVEAAVPEVLSSAGVDKDEVAGVGVDFTSCTVLPVTRDGIPLCRLPEWRSRPHAWPKLWKHHAAQPVADRLNEVAGERGEDFLSRYGGKLSSEWYFPKLIELWLEDREVYDAAYGFIEATDWIVWQLTGNERRATCTAGYKACWSERDGLPSVEFFEAAYPGFSRPAEKLGMTFHQLGSPAGRLRAEVASRIGLDESTVVAVGNVDSFVSVPGAGIDQPGTYLMVVGTSICDLVIHPQEIRLPGITGVVRDGILPGSYGYEAGQVAVGDMLAWFVEEIRSADGSVGDKDPYEALEQAAARFLPGQTGLVAMDWWNGNRTILADADLTGVIAGLTLQTSQDEIYRALLESIAFGNRRIMDNFSEHGLDLGEIVACGGIAEKSPLMMQLLADTSGRPVHIPASKQIPARGAALFGAVAAGAFEDIEAAIAATRPETARSYLPDREAGAVYDAVYEIYRELHDTLGQSQAELLHKLKRIHVSAAAPVAAGDLPDSGADRVDD
jgi:L-ribulokinase